MDSIQQKESEGLERAPQPSQGAEQQLVHNDEDREQKTAAPGTPVNGEGVSGSTLSSLRPWAVLRQKHSLLSPHEGQCGRGRPRPQTRGPGPAHTLGLVLVQPGPSPTD